MRIFAATAGTCKAEEADGDEFNDFSTTLAPYGRQPRPEGGAADNALNYDSFSLQIAAIP